MRDHGDYGDPYPISSARPATRNTNREVVQGLDQQWFIDPDASMSVWVTDIFILLIVSNTNGGWAWLATETDQLDPL